MNIGKWPQNWELPSFALIRARAETTFPMNRTTGNSAREPGSTSMRRGSLCQNYQMYSYITQELTDLVGREFPLDMARQAITGHSMGGHGALTIALKTRTASSRPRPSRPSFSLRRRAGPDRRWKNIWAPKSGPGVAMMPRCLSRMVTASRNFWSTRVQPTAFSMKACVHGFWKKPAGKPTFPSRSTCVKAMTIPISSSPPSWAITCAGTGSV